MSQENFIIGMMNGEADRKSDISDHTPFSFPSFGRQSSLS